MILRSDNYYAVAEQFYPTPLSRRRCWRALAIDILDCEQPPKIHGFLTYYEGVLC
jgi:hypothetical protein